MTWAAIVLMVIDHVGVFLAPEVWALRLVGRGAFPLFAGLIAYNLAVRGVSTGKYLGRLGLFAVIAQVPFGAIFGWLHLNIFVTLGLGVILVGLANRKLSWWWALLLPLGLTCDYGLAGVLLVPAAAAVWSGAFQREALVMSAVLAGLAQPGPIWSAAAVVWVAIIAVVVRSGRLPGMSRAPRWFGYAFYPGHMVVLALLSLA